MKQRYLYYGQKAKAEAVELRACDELAERFSAAGVKARQQQQAAAAAAGGKGGGARAA